MKLIKFWNELSYNAKNGFWMTLITTVLFALIIYEFNHIPHHHVYPRP